MLGSATNGNVSLIVGVTKDLTAEHSGRQSHWPGGAESWRQGRRAARIWRKPAEKILAALDAALGEAYGVVERLLG